MNPIKRISEKTILGKNELMEILDSSKLRPCQRAIRARLHANVLMARRLTHSKHQTLSIYISLSSLLIRIKSKSTRRCFCAISNTLLTHIKVQIHTKDITHTLCKYKQEPHWVWLRWIFRFKANKLPQLNEKNKNLLPIMLDLTKKMIKKNHRPDEIP
jgi:hypothetical protein